MWLPPRLHSDLMAVIKNSFPIVLLFPLCCTCLSKSHSRQAEYLWYSLYLVEMYFVLALSLKHVLEKKSLVPLISKSFSLFSPADLASYATGKHSSPETRSHAFQNIFFLSLLWSFHAHLYVKVVSLVFMRGSLYSFFLLSNSTGMEGITWEQRVQHKKGRRASAASWETATCLSLVCFDCFIFSISSYLQEYTYCVMELCVWVA